MRRAVETEAYNADDNEEAEMERNAIGTTAGFCGND